MSQPPCSFLIKIDEVLISLEPLNDIPRFAFLAMSFTVLEPSIISAIVSGTAPAKKIFAVASVLPNLSAPDNASMFCLLSNLGPLYGLLLTNEQTVIDL